MIKMPRSLNKLDHHQKPLKTFHPIYVHTPIIIISMHPAIIPAAILFFTIANISTCYLYLYPLAHNCGFPTPPPSTTNSNSNQPAPFRLLVLADPQLEGDSSLPTARDGYFPSAQKLVSAYKTSGAFTPNTRSHFIDIAYKDIPRLLRLLRKRLDLLGNDYYLAHIFRTLSTFINPTHVTVLGDLIGSQWVSDEEFERRGRRYWGRVFQNARRVEDEIMGGRSVTSLVGDERWKWRVINVAGNHDIGYGGDLKREKIERFERVYGKVNWETRFTLPVTGGEEAGMDLPELKLLVLNSLNMDAPVLSHDLQADTYHFINDVIAASKPVEDTSSATILLTHLPLHKEDGVCVDGPMTKYYDSDSGGAIKEQNHLSSDASKGVLEGIFGKSGKPDAPAGGLGRNGIILTGHDHDGCDVYHHLPEVSDPELRSWTAERTDVSTLKRHGEIPGIREITVRSMMGDFGGNAGLLSAWYDDGAGKWLFGYSTCKLGTQHIWWAVHVFDLVTLMLLNYVGWQIWRGSKTSQSKEKTQ